MQIGNADEVLLVEVAHSAFKHLFAYVEHAFNVFGLALIAEGARAAMFLQILQQGIGKVEGLSAACRLQRDIEFSVKTNIIDVSLYAVACVQRTEHLVVVHQSGITVVYNYLEAQVSFLPYRQVGF